VEKANQRIHALIFKAKDKDRKNDRINVLYLTDEYRITLDQPAIRAKYKEITPTPAPVISIARAGSTSKGENDLPVASFTTLYGDYGCGKTELMHKLCLGLANENPKAQVAVLWSNDDRLTLSRGNVLNDYSLDPTDLSIAGSRTFPATTPIFYTTSPFENQRRARLRSKGITDVSPDFGGGNEFNAFALLRAYPHLANRERFIDEAKVQVRLKIPTIKALLHSREAEEIRARFGKENPHFSHEIELLDNALTPQVRMRLVLALVMSFGRGARESNLFPDLLNTVFGRLADWKESASSYRIKDIERRLNDYEIEGLDGNRFRSAQRVANLLFNGITQRRTQAFPLGELYHLLNDELRYGDEVISHLTIHNVLGWSFTELSSGEVAFMMLYANLAKSLSPLEYTTVGPIFLCLDEGEMFMHPKWQRDYISGVLGFLEKFPDVAPKVHVFMSTHSLIVAADTPPNRLFDVLEGRHVNGFGLNPKQTLSDVFHVDNFSGRLSTKRMESITRCLRNGWNPEELNEARAIAATLADDHLRAYVEQKLGNLGENPNAQD
jgi:hypothetical protein